VIRWAESLDDAEYFDALMGLGEYADLPEEEEEEEEEDV